jgi:hypothetical protein
VVAVVDGRVVHRSRSTSTERPDQQRHGVDVDGPVEVNVDLSRSCRTGCSRSRSTGRTAGVMPTTRPTSASRMVSETTHVGGAGRPPQVLTHAAQFPAPPCPRCRSILGMCTPRAVDRAARMQDTTRTRRPRKCPAPPMLATRTGGRILCTRRGAAIVSRTCVVSCRVLTAAAQASGALHQPAKGLCFRGWRGSSGPLRCIQDPVG